MKRVYFAFLIGFSWFIQLSAFGVLPYLEVENFSANYQNPHGTAYAEQLRYLNHDMGRDSKFEVYQQGAEFVLQSADSEIRVDSLPQAVYEWEALNVERLDISSRADSFSLVSKKIEYVSGDGEKGLVSGISAACEKLSKNEAVNSLLDMCLNQKMNFYLPFMQGVGVSNINVWSDNNAFDFSFKKGVWIKGDGAIFYNEKDKVVRIRVDRAKAGFFSVKARLFSELEAMENEFVTVNNPWVEIRLP